MTLRTLISILVLLSATSAGHAQNVVVPPVSTAPLFTGPCGTAFPGYFVPNLSSDCFGNASTSSIVAPPTTDQQIAATNQQLSAVTAQANANSAALTLIAARLDRLSNRFNEGIALAGAINVLPPNPGDRFAISFGGAGYGGAGAGSISVSTRINENTIAYLGYARGPTQNFVKGGVGFSFR